MRQRSVLITGGFGVLGTAVAKGFAARGYRVVRVDYAASPGGERSGGLEDAENLGGIDLSDTASTQKVFNDVAANGGLDVLVNVAGGFTWQRLEDDAGDTWQKMFRLNALTCRNSCAAALPWLKQAEQGRIINIGAFGAVTAAAGMGAYAASKAAVHKLTESLAAELADTAVTVNAVLPTIIDTPANRADMPGEDHGTWVQPAAIADVICFLASAEARAISGALIPVSRGG